MGLHEDLNEATKNEVTKMALREMIDLLITEKRLTRDEAYMLASVAAHLDITQLVDGNKGVHAMIPKAIFISSHRK
jgi:acetamidase/formamidase